MNRLTRPPEDQIRPREVYAEFIGGRSGHSLPHSPVLAAGGGRVQIRLSIPAKACHQNSRAHYMAKARAVKEQRQEACRVALEARMVGDLLKPWRAARAELRFTFKDKRRRDPSNFAAAMKGAWDGIVDSGLLVDDDKLAVSPPEMAVGAEEFCEVTIYEIQ